MSTEHYDLAARLRAATTGHLVNRSQYAPALAPREPLAITLTPHPDGRWALTATERTHPRTDLHSAPHNGSVAHPTSVRTATGYGRDALSALAALGVGTTIIIPPTLTAPPTTATIPTGPAPAGPAANAEADPDAPSEPFRTLVVADAATLQRLHTVLAHTPRGSRWDAQAAVLAWWLQRAEHPGSAAVLNVVATCTARWYTGDVPRAERHPETWLAWHHLTTPTPAPALATGADLLDLADLATNGTPLPGLEPTATGDERSWKYHLDRLGGGWNFRRSDTRTEAALGLATRCDATELYDSQRLDDPLVADRARFDGTIVTGTLTWINNRSVELTADRLPCRLRAGSSIEGTTTGGTATGFRATVSDTRMSSTGELVFTLDDLTVRGGSRSKKTASTLSALAVGQHVELRPQRVLASQQQQSRSNRRFRYTGGGNWLVRETTPAPTRRDVPWDVIVAAATD